jgi:ABC-type uncharacterized transport system involved in gliding motility auxiliary subunit
MIYRILNIVGWIGMVLVAAAVGIRFGMPAQDQYVPYLAWGGLACLVAYTLSQWREIAKAFTRRQTRYGTLLVVSVVVFLGILVAINYIGASQNKRWDLTESKQYTLADQSTNFLSKLDAPLEILVFVEDTRFQQFRDRLQGYEYSSKQVTTQYIDPDKKRELAQQNEVKQYGTIVFKYKGRVERITSNDEQDITNAIIKVVTGEQKKVYFTQGHGEKNPDDVGRDGYAQLAGALKSENYLVEKLVLAQTSAVPDDASVVVVAGPKIDFLPNEIDVLKMYLAKGGKLMLAVDPPDEASSAAVTNLAALAHEWGMDLGNDMIIDTSGMGRLIGASEAMPVAANYPVHPITERFDIMTVFPLSRSVTAVQNGVDGHVASAFVETSARSWSETDLRSLYAGQPVVAEEEKGDKKGPISVAAAASAAVAADPAKPDDGTPRKETRVAVFGDSDFAANSSVGQIGNKDLFLNTVGWLSQQENLIAIRPKDPTDRRITLTEVQRNNLMLLSLFVIPGLIFGSGVYSWWRRR